ncbi:MAG: hypothetical protein LUB61_07930 [Eggerthellaceae bacterium]|nr:hypothetical protein [Eggerthellaceae bacterium]
MKRQYARILIVTNRLYDQSDVIYRMERLAQNLGHATQLLFSDPTSEGFTDALEKACSFFEPTLVLWDAQCSFERSAIPAAEVMINYLGCAKVLVNFDYGCYPKEGGVDFGEAEWSDDLLNRFECVVLGQPSEEYFAQREKRKLPPAIIFLFAPEQSYQNAAISDPDLERSGILCDQDYTEGRYGTLERAAAVAHAKGSPAKAAPKAAGRVVGISTAWPVDKGGLYIGDNHAFAARTTRFYVAFEGKDAPDLARIAQRICEGNVVVAEKGLVDSLP